MGKYKFALLPGLHVNWRLRKRGALEEAVDVKLSTFTLFSDAKIARRLDRNRLIICILCKWRLRGLWFQVGWSRCEQRAHVEATHVTRRAWISVDHQSFTIESPTTLWQPLSQTTMALNFLVTNASFTKWLQLLRIWQLSNKMPQSGIDQSEQGGI